MSRKHPLHPVQDEVKLSVCGCGHASSLDSVEAQFKFLQGKVLTLIEASYQDAEQRKAMKSLIKSAFNDQLMRI